MSLEIPFVVAKWTREAETQPEKRYAPHHVNSLLSMLRRTQSRPVRLICVTDDSAGLDPSIERVPIPARGKEIINTLGMQFFKLYLFSEEFRRTVGKKFIYCDLDVSLQGDVSEFYDRAAHLTIMEGKNAKLFSALEAMHGGPLPSRRSFGLLSRLFLAGSFEQAFTYAKLGQKRWCRYNSSFMIISRNQPDDPWSSFVPDQVRKEILTANLCGSDQAWLHLHKKGVIETVGRAHGFWYKGEVDRFYKKSGSLPSNTKLIIFPGPHSKPWLAQGEGSAWLRQVYPTTPDSHAPPVVAARNSTWAT
jgi:hypothetical protein